MGTTASPAATSVRSEGIGASVHYTTVEATPEAYRELARAQVFSAAPCRAQIALANGKLYARDQKKLSCFEVK